MSTPRPPLLAFLRDFALALPAFHLRRHRMIMGGEFVAIPADAVRPESPLAAYIGGRSDGWVRDWDPETGR
jgi:hypothetical protein